MRRTGWSLFAFLAVAFLPGAAGLIWQPGDWYLQLDTPRWTPPVAVFPTVWSVLYASLGVAAWRVWRRSGGFSRCWGAMLLFALQLALNGTWCWVFFGLHRIDLAMTVALALWAAAFAMFFSFRNHNMAGGLLVAPYLAWVGFAALLNGAIWWMNRAK